MGIEDLRVYLFAGLATRAERRACFGFLMLAFLGLTFLDLTFLGRLSLFQFWLFRFFLFEQNCTVGYPPLRKPIVRPLHTALATERDPIRVLDIFSNLFVLREDPQTR
jgi:hypothetical protein